MFTLGRGMFNEFVKKKEYYVLILGIDDVGKTVIILSFLSYSKSYLLYI